MFAAAKVLNMERELSRILREEGVRHGQVLPGDHVLFVNTHPAEMEDVDLLVYSLHELRGSRTDSPARAGDSRSRRDKLRRDAAAPHHAERSSRSASPTTTSAPARRGSSNWWKFDPTI